MKIGLVVVVAIIAYVAGALYPSPVGIVKAKLGL